MLYFRRYPLFFLATTTALVLMISGCAALPSSAPAASPSASDVAVDLSGIRSYLLEKTGQLEQATAALKESSDRSLQRKTK